MSRRKLYHKRIIISINSKQLSCLKSLGNYSNLIRHLINDIMDDPERPVKFKTINKLFIEKTRLDVKRKRLSSESEDYKNLSGKIIAMNQEIRRIMSDDAAE